MGSNCWCVVVVAVDASFPQMIYPSIRAEFVALPWKNEGLRRRPSPKMRPEISRPRKGGLGHEIQGWRGSHAVGCCWALDLISQLNGPNLVLRTQYSQQPSQCGVGRRGRRSVRATVARDTTLIFLGLHTTASCRPSGSLDAQLREQSRLK